MGVSYIPASPRPQRQDMSEKVTIVGVLREWRRQFCDRKGTSVIWGHIYDDILNRFPDGHFIHTAKIVKIEGDLVFTKNSVYRLEGEPAGPPFGTGQ